VKRNLLKFFLSLVVVSAVLTWFWLNGLQLSYALLFKTPAQFTFRLLKIYKSGVTLVIEHFTNLIPFIALSVSLPGVAIKKRLIRLVLGLIILMVVHFLLIISVSKIYATYSLSQTAYKYMFPLFILNDALPLALWFVFFSEEILSLFRRRKPAAE